MPCLESAPTMASAPNIDALLDGICRNLEAQTGLQFLPERWPDLRRGLAVAAQQAGLPLAEFLPPLLAPIWSPALLAKVVANLTVGETYFFRDPQSNAFIEQQVLRPLLAERAATGARTLRIWSAGCCTGEEAYTLAFMLERLLTGEPPWSVQLLASDINPVFLQQAARAEYGVWSLRNTPDWARARYFVALGHERYRVIDSIRARVQFAQLNLLDANDASWRTAWRSSLPNTPELSVAGFDLIVCRNVLMYLSSASVKTVVARFHAALKPGGWLVVSPCEAAVEAFQGFALVAHDGGSFYRKIPVAQANAVPTGPQPAALLFEPAWALPPVWSPTSESIGDALNAPAISANGVITPTPAATATVADADALADPTADTESEAKPEAELDALLLAARRCADQKQLELALRHCQHAITLAKCDARAYFLMAMIEQEQGQDQAAIQSLARALYLQPDLIMANYALGQLCRRHRQPAQARRHFANTLHSLHALADDAVVPEAGELTAGQLRLEVRKLLAQEGRS